MTKQRKIKIAITVLITTIVSAIICFFFFERVGEIIFFTAMLDFFLLAMITIISGAVVSARVGRIYAEHIMNRGKGDEQPDENSTKE